MIKIVNKLGENEMFVTNGAYENLYKSLGYKIVGEKEVKEEVKETKQVEKESSLASTSIDKDEKEETVKSEEIFKTTLKRKK
jgi:hypothetical protein